MPTLLLTALLLAASPSCPDDVVDTVEIYSVENVWYTSTIFTRFNMVFIGDGYTEDEQGKFDDDVEAALNWLECCEPFRDKVCAFNVYKVNVVSPASGVDRPYEGLCVESALNCQYGHPDEDAYSERCIISFTPDNLFEAAEAATTNYDVIVILVNDDTYGACAVTSDEYPFVFSYTGKDFYEVLTHELGHRIAGLEDEYTTTTLTYSGSEPGEANVTTDTGSSIKWGDLVETSVPMPTTAAELLARGVPEDSLDRVVGAWHGADDYADGIYRPQKVCHMRMTDRPFCAVCERELRASLPRFCWPVYLRPLLLNVDHLPWLADRYFHWPLPFCMHCFASSPADTVDVMMGGLGPDAELSIVDVNGAVIAGGFSAGPGNMRTVFLLDDPSVPFYVELRPGPATSDTLSVNTLLRINGVLITLP